MATEADFEHDIQHFSRKRPFSPTESRERVKKQARYATDIITLDDDDDDEAATQESDYEPTETRSTPTPRRNGPSHYMYDTDYARDRTFDQGNNGPVIYQDSFATMMPNPPQFMSDEHKNVVAQTRTHSDMPYQCSQTSTADARRSSWLETPSLSHIEFDGEAGLSYALERLQTLHTAGADDDPTITTNQRHAVRSTIDQLAKNQEQERAIRMIRSIRGQRAASSTVTPQLLSPAMSNKSSLVREDRIDRTHTKLSAYDSGTIQIEFPGQRECLPDTRNFDKIDGHVRAGSRQGHSFLGEHRQARPHPHSNRGVRERERRSSQRTAIRGGYSVRPSPARSGERKHFDQDRHTDEPPPRFYAPLDSPPLRRRNQPSPGVLKYRRTGTAPAARLGTGNNLVPNEVESDVDDRTDDPVLQDDNGHHSAIRELLSNTPPPAPLSNNEDENWLSVLRPRGDLLDITLPKGFDDLKPETQEAILDYENEKERQKDLDTLKEALTAWGRTACTGDVRQTELRDLRHYAIAVLDKNLSGKQQRSRIQNIKSRNQRRTRQMSGYVQPSDMQFQDILKPVISPELLEHLLKERRRSKAIVDDLHARQMGMRDAERKHRKRERREERHQERERKRGEQKTTCYRDSELGSKSQSGKKVSGSRKKTRTQQVQEKIDELDASLKRSSLSIPGSGPEHRNEMSSEGEGGQTSDESEEEEGAEFLGIANAGCSSTNALKVVHEAAQSQSDTMKADCSANSISSIQISGLGRTTSTALQVNQQQQQVTPDLVRENLRRQRMYQSQQSKAIEVAEQETEDETDCESFNNDDDDQESPGRDDHKDHSVIRYVVNACFRGFRERTDGDTYLIGHFYELPQADQKLDEVISLAKQEYIHGTSEQRCLKLSLHQSYEDEKGYLRRMALRLGQDEEAECAVWVEEEQHDLSEEAFQQAKTEQLVRKKPLWIVIWEKTEYYREVDSDSWTTNENTSLGEKSVLASACTASSKTRYRPPYVEDVTEDQVQIFHEQAMDLAIEYDTIEHKSAESYRTEADERSSSIESQLGSDGQSTQEDLSGDTTLASSLSSPGPCPQGPASTTAYRAVVTHTAHQDLKGYTRIADANRAAFTRYLDWWYSTLTPALKADHAWLRSEENFLEEEVRGRGDIHLWESSKKEVVLGTEIMEGRHFEKVVVYWTAVREFPIDGPANTGYGE